MCLGFRVLGWFSGGFAGVGFWVLFVVFAGFPGFLVALLRNFGLTFGFCVALLVFGGVLGWFGVLV